jgi:putative DNA primase/helicase
LGEIPLRVQSVTTEAGLRQALGQDARPVLFDEAELDDPRAAGNIQRVLELARQASSETGAVIVKGSATGEVMTYVIRSCFCLASIAVGVRRRADETRVTVLAMRRQSTDTDEDRAKAARQFAAVQRMAEDVCTPEYSAGLIARSCKMAKVIRENAETFAIAVSQALGSRRTGDQLGTLLAGYWSLWRDDAVTLADAAEYAWSLHLNALAPDPESQDEHRCLAHLLEQTLRVDVPNKAPLERSIGELIDAAGDGKDSDGRASDVPHDIADATLRRHGIRVTTDGLSISNTHSAIARLLAGTPWAGKWNVFLRRLPGATAPDRAVTFPGRVVSRVTEIPWSAITGETTGYPQQATEGPYEGRSQTTNSTHHVDEHEDIPF